MFDVYLGNVRMITTDELADAILDFSRLLVERQQTEVITFPVYSDGLPTRAKVLTGYGTPVAAIERPDDLSPELDGAELAVWDIQRRAAVLIGGASGLDWGPAR